MKDTIKTTTKQFSVYAISEIEAKKREIRENWGICANSEYLAELWGELHKMRGYVSCNLNK